MLAEHHSPLPVKFTYIELLKKDLDSRISVTQYLAGSSHVAAAPFPGWNTVNIATPIAVVVEINAPAGCY